MDEQQPQPQPQPLDLDAEISAAALRQASQSGYWQGYMDACRLIQARGIAAVPAQAQPAAQPKAHAGTFDDPLPAAPHSLPLVQEV